METVYVAIILSMVTFFVVGLAALTELIVVGVPAETCGVKTIKVDTEGACLWHLCDRMDRSRSAGNWGKLTVLPLQPLVLQLKKCCYVDFNPLYCSTMHDCALTQEQLPDCVSILGMSHYFVFWVNVTESCKGTEGYDAAGLLVAEL